MKCTQLFYLVVRHGDVSFAGVGVVLVGVEHDDGVRQGVRGVRVSKALVITEIFELFEGNVSS